MSPSTRRRWHGSLRTGERPQGASRMEAAGVEREKREIGNLLMARDFWG